MNRTKVEGIDYSPVGIEALRQEWIGIRGEAMKQLPDSAGFIMVATHTIALLADYKEMREAEEKMWHCPQCRQFVEAKQISTIVDGLVLIECPKCYHQKETPVMPGTTQPGAR